MPYHSFKIRDLSLQVRLGCLPDERVVTQEVRLTVELRFHVAPKAIHSDDLSETVCYAQLSEAFQAYVHGKEFCLVEKLANDLYEIAKKFVGSQAEIALSAHKVKPPVDGLLGGVDYRIGDFA